MCVPDGIVNPTSFKNHKPASFENKIKNKIRRVFNKKSTKKMQKQSTMLVHSQVHSLTVLKKESEDIDQERSESRLSHEIMVSLASISGIWMDTPLIWKLIKGYNQSIQKDELLMVSCFKTYSRIMYYNINLDDI